MQERVGARHDAPGNPELVQQPLQNSLGREEVSRTGVGVAPGLPTHGPGEERGHVVGLVGEPLALARQVHGPGLKQAEGRDAAGLVPSRRVEQRTEQHNDGNDVDVRRIRDPDVDRA